MKTPQLPGRSVVSQVVRTIASVNADSKVRTCLWFESGGEEAARFYVTPLADSRIESSYRPDPDGPPLVLDFTLAGAPYQILKGGPEFSQDPAVSISVVTENQAETDRLWDALVADGGKEGKCSWLTDRFGVSWQIVPRALIGIAAGGRETHVLFAPIAPTWSRSAIHGRNSHPSASQMNTRSPRHCAP